MGGSAEHISVAVRVKPGSRSPGVGGSWGDPPALIVAVAQRAVEGAANEAVVSALSRAFGVPLRSVGIVRGRRSRSKVVRIAGDAGELRRRLAALLRG